MFVNPSTDAIAQLLRAARTIAVVDSRPIAPALATVSRMPCSASATGSFR